MPSEKQGAELFVKGVCKIAITRNAFFSSKCSTNLLVAGLCLDPEGNEGEIGCGT